MIIVTDSLLFGKSYNLDYSRARAYCTCSRCGWGCLDIFTLIYPFSPLSPSLWETARYRLKYCLKGPLSPKQPTNLFGKHGFTPYCKKIWKMGHLKTIIIVLKLTCLVLQCSYESTRNWLAGKQFRPRSNCLRSILIGVCTVCSGLPVPIFKFWGTHQIFKSEKSLKIITITLDL